MKFRKKKYSCCHLKLVQTCWWNVQSTLHDLKIVRTCQCQHSYNYQVIVACDEFSFQIGMAAELSCIKEMLICSNFPTFYGYCSHWNYIMVMVIVAYTRLLRYKYFPTLMFIILFVFFELKLFADSFFPQSNYVLIEKLVSPTNWGF
jgi:hypothetical protein